MLRRWLRPKPLDTATVRPVEPPPAEPPADQAQPAHDIYRAMFQLRFAATIGWVVDWVSVEGTELTMSGWALAQFAPPGAMRFCINRQPFQHVEWPRDSADVASVFNELPCAAASRFLCRHAARSAGDLFPGDYACLSFTGPHGLHQDTYRRAQFLLDPSLEPPLPDFARINRVINGDAMSYRMGGATMTKRLDAYLAQRFGRPLSSFAAILDWGSGAGRVTRHLARLFPGRATGIDIDADNVAWCASAFPGAAFAQGPLQPPLAFEDASFDLVISISVFTHLDEATQFRWLRELRRLVRPGGIVLASIHGLAQMAFYDASARQVLETGERGFVVLGQNSQLDGFIEDGDYYKNIAHSPDYVLGEWSRYFDVVEIVESIATNQDLVVMMRS